MEEKKKAVPEGEASLPVQELPADIPAEVRQKLAEDLNEEATEDLKQDIREAEKEEANDEEVKADPEMLTKSRLLKMLVKKQYVKLREVTEEEQPADLAELLEELDENNRLVVFRLLKKEVATEAFAYMSDEARDDLVNAFSDVELVSAIEEMSLDDAADLLEDMPAGVVKRVLEKSSKQTRESLNKLLNYPESSAGSLMTPEYVRLRKDMTVNDAFGAIRTQGESAETVYTCYVVERNRLLGVVSARSLLLAEPKTPVTEIMDDNVVTVKVTDDQEYVAREMQRYDFTAMPVVDNEGMFVGIITIDDAIDVLTDESTEDMQKMAAILPDDDATTYFGTSVWTHAKQRIPWLLILMLSATFTGMVTTHYEEAFVSLPLQRDACFRHCGRRAGPRERPAHLPDVHVPVRRAVRECPWLCRCGQRVAVLQRHPGKAGGWYAAPCRQEAGCGPGHHGDPLHHHHRGCLQLDPVLPDRAGRVPEYDVTFDFIGATLSVKA